MSSFQPTLWDSISAISLQESESGHTHSGKPDGQMSAPCGPEVAPVNLSPQQAKDLGLLMSGTFGRHGIT